ncbi:hypothetical protein [Anaerococcus provencensis]|uniref:hypothetical protein n=1 Tax=Anaerococcus provencensis TaxID=938293 RepID=UPI0003178E92|nr:hypothetical protein [Anaerococcus provencensis]
MKLSININEYKKNLTKLRMDLDQTLAEGHLDVDFKEKLDELEDIENKMLKELLPYYRIYAPELYRTKVNELEVKIDGNNKLQSYLKSYIHVEENIFILASADQKVYFMRSYGKDNQHIEVSQAIKNFNKLVIYMHRLSKEKILLFTVTGDIYVFMSNNFTDIFENPKNLRIIKLKNNFEGFENIINIGESTFLCQIGRNEFIVLEIDVISLKIKIKNHINLSDLDEEINSLVKISNFHFALGSHRGDLILVSFKEDEIKVYKKIKIFDNPIINLAILESESYEKTLCISQANSDNIFLYNLKSKKLTNVGLDESNSTILSIESKKSSAFILREDFNLYLLEENMEKWNINSKLSIADRPFVNIIGLDNSTYLTIDIYGNFSILKLDRLDSIEKLRDINLFMNRG